jgi:hypothetical protein
MIRIWGSAWPAAAMVAVTLTGCAGLESGRSPGPAALAGAYNQGVRDALAHLSAERAPHLHHIWTAPVVQEVWVPARMVDAVFVPAHREWVVIHPAEWQRQPRSTAPHHGLPPRP